MGSKAKGLAGKGGGPAAPGAGASAKAKGGGRAGARGKRGKKGKNNKKKPLKCGDNGRYDKMQQRTAENKYDRDHVPSKGALKEKAMRLNGGKALCPDQKAAIDAAGDTIAIPKWLHKMYSRTYGSKNNTPARIKQDADNLQKAAEKDIRKIKEGLGNRKMSAECRKKYNEWARQAKGRTNRSYNDMLRKAMGKP